MATKKEIDQILKELNISKLEMDYFYRNLQNTNWLVKKLIEAKKDWTELTPSVIKTIPFQKEKDLESLKNKNLLTKEILEVEEKRKKISENFEEIAYVKILKKQELSEYELSKLLKFEHERILGTISNGKQKIDSIINLCDNYLLLSWVKNHKDNSEIFKDQPYEVEKKEYTKMITVTEWVKL